MIMKRKDVSTQLLFTILSITASGLNFLFYPILARSLNLAAFGDVQIGIAFVMQAAALFTSLNLVALLISAHKSMPLSIVVRIERIIIWVGIVAAILITSFAAPLSQLLQLHDPSLLYILSPILVINVPAGTWIGVLQGEGKFVTSGVIAVITSLIKILAALACIAMGMGAHGALLGLLLGTAATLPLVYLTHSPRRLNILSTFKPVALVDVREILQYKNVVYMLIAFFFLSLISTVDIVVAKIIFNPEVAGVYSQLSVIGKIPYFALIPLAIIGFERFIKKSSDQSRFITIFVILLLFVSLTLVIIEPFIASLLFNLPAKLYDASTATALLIAFSAYTLTTLLCYSLVAMGSYKYPLVVLLLFTVASVVVCAFAKTPVDLAVSYAILQVALLGIFLLLRYTVKR